MTTPRVPIVPASADLPDWAARRILELHRAELPDLSRVTLLLPSRPAARDLRRRLAQHAGRGLLGPNIQLLGDFAAARTVPAAADGPALSALDCQLLLAAALKRHRNIFPGQDNAQLADALFQLFEELDTGAAALPEDETAFAGALQKAYGADGTKPLSWLSFEAQIVHRLWQAFRTDSGGRSPARLYRQRLAQAFQSLRSDERVYLIGFDELDAAECAAVRAALNAGQAQLWLHGRLDGRDGAALADLCGKLEIQPQVLETEAGPRRQLLDAAFGNQSAPLTLTLNDSPGLRIVEAAGPEHEARCVELAVRQALLDGRRDVVVLTQDRRLARRLRALLERAGIVLHDPVGWALSTSQAAAALNAWLECLDSGFHFRPLLELLKSGFIPAEPAAVQRLERDLIYRSEIEQGLERFISAARMDAPLLVLLQRVKAAAHGNPPPESTQPAQRWTAALSDSLRELGAWPLLQQDVAGRKLLALLEQLQAAFQRHALALDGEQFRALLDRTTEAETFVPELVAGPVRLLTLEQSQNLRCDMLILAGASRAQLPGAPAAQPFFNQSVRAELGLAGWPQRQSLALARLRRVLESAPLIWISYAPESPDEDAQPSPWIEAIEAQAESSGRTLRETELARLAGTAAVEIDGTEPSASAGGNKSFSMTPAEPRNRPAPAAANDLLPAKISASAHQTLLDCPYRFHVQYLLGLRAEQAPDEDADRSDYGGHVHRILEGFTQPVKGLPPPFESAVTPANREQAHARLEQIAQAVFEPELRTRALALIWRAEFQSAIPALLDWLEQRGPLATVQAEVPLANPLGPFTLAGKADRLETRADGTRVVVDYKTGRIPKRVEVESGEAVQLLHYAALDKQIVSVEYWPLKDGERPLEIGDELAGLRDGAERRVSDLLQRITAGAALTAHGDDDTCEHCDYRGLCRKGDWADV